jgi:hypothetical protein
LTSKIINMAERIKDEQDRLLESMFESAPIADDGFSKQIMRRIRRKLWIRRITLPVAIFLGGLLAFQPVVSLLKGVYQLLSSLPADLLPSLEGSLPSLQLIVTGALVLFVLLFTLNVIED